MVSKLQFEFQGMPSLLTMQTLDIHGVHMTSPDSIERDFAIIGKVVVNRHNQQTSIFTVLVHHFEHGSI